MRPQVCSSHLSLKGLGKSWERRLALKQPQAQVTYLWYQASLLHFPCGLGSVSVLWSPSVGMSSGKWTPWHIFLALWRDGESVQPFNQAQWVWPLASKNSVISPLPTCPTKIWSPMYPTSPSLLSIPSHHLPICPVLEESREDRFVELPPIHSKVFWWHCDGDPMTDD